MINLSILSKANIVKFIYINQGFIKNISDLSHALGKLVFTSNIDLQEIFHLWICMAKEAQKNRPRSLIFIA